MWIRHLLPATGWCRKRKCWCQAKSCADCYEDPRLRKAWKWTARLVGLGMLVLMVGCTASLFNFTKESTNVPKIPAKPVPAVALEENVQKEAQATSDLANTICGGGTRAQSRDAKQLVKCADKVVTYLGKPSIPVDITKDEELAQLHKQFEAELTKHRADLKTWEQTLADLREENAKLTEQVGTWKASYANLWFWFIFVLVALGVLTFFFPAVMVPLLKRSASVAWGMLHRQTSEIVQAVQEARKHPEMPEDAKKLLDGILGNKLSGDTKVLVSKIKSGLGGKLS